MILIIINDTNNVIEVNLIIKIIVIRSYYIFLIFFYNFKYII